MNRPDGRLATRRYQNIYDKNQSIGLKHITYICSLLQWNRWNHKSNLNMKHFKIITMGILASILSLLGCGYGNKRATQSESINPYIPVAAQITMDKLPGVLKNVKAGRTEYDFTGICANGVDCIYFMQDNGKFYIDWSHEQRPTSLSEYIEAVCQRA